MKLQLQLFVEKIMTLQWLCCNSTTFITKYFIHAIYRQSDAFFQKSDIEQDRINVWSLHFYE